MNFFDFQEKFYSRPTMDDSAGEKVAEVARQQQAQAAHGEEKSAKAAAAFTDATKVLSAEEMQEHRKHCRAKPGNCPFEKAVDEADDITPNEIKVTKQDVFNRLAAVLTQLFQVAKNLAKPAIAEPEKVEQSAIPSHNVKTSTDEKPAHDEAPADEPNADAKTVAEIIEAGIEKMVELAKSKGCMVDMDDKNSKYIVKGPVKGSGE